MKKPSWGLLCDCEIFANFRCELCPFVPVKESPAKPRSFISYLLRLSALPAGTPPLITFAAAPFSATSGDPWEKCLLLFDNVISVQSRG